MYLLSFSNISKAEILITIFYLLWQSSSYMYESFNFMSYRFKINVNKNSVKYLQGILFFSIKLYFVHTFVLILTQTNILNTTKIYCQYSYFFKTCSGCHAYLLIEKIETDSSVHITLGLVISQSSWRIMPSYVRKADFDSYAKHRWLTACVFFFNFY